MKVLEKMKNKALEMRMQGVAVAAVLNQGETADWIGDMKVVETPCNLKEGWNLVAIAWSKCGEVIATEADSGNPNHKKLLGECGFVGGAYEEYNGYKMAFAFSGASSEDDLIVAKYGIGEMKPFLKRSNSHDKKVLLANLDKIHTTPLGVGRIEKNLKISGTDVIEFCKKQISGSNITHDGKNWYCQTADGVVITVNSSSYTIITAHRK